MIKYPFNIIKDLIVGILTSEDTNDTCLAVSQIVMPTF